MKTTIPVFFASDDNYMPYLIITMESIVQNASKEYDYIFYILNTGISEQNIERAQKYNYGNFKVEFVNVDEKINKFGEALHTRDYYSKAIYYRLFIPSLFPQYKKAIYMDCDIIVQGDVSNLYNVSLGNNLLGAVSDEVVYACEEFVEYTENVLGVKAPNYFNSGVLLMNLEGLRAIDFEQKFINIFGSYTFTVASDQDYINVICKDKVTYIDNSWNKMPFVNTIKMEDVNLIHFNLTAKPWHYDNILYGDAFWKYAKQTDVYEIVLNEKNTYDIKNIQKDSECEVKLREMAKKQSQQKVKFFDLIQSGEIDSTTFLRNELYDAKKFIQKIVSDLNSTVLTKCKKKNK